MSFSLLELLPWDCEVVSPPPLVPPRNTDRLLANFTTFTGIPRTSTDLTDSALTVLGRVTQQASGHISCWTISSLSFIDEPSFTRGPRVSGVCLPSCLPQQHTVCRSRPLNQRRCSSRDTPFEAILENSSTLGRGTWSRTLWWVAGV